MELLLALVLVIAASIIIAGTRKASRRTPAEAAEDRKWMDAIK